jgi:hypothetical protein
LLWVGFRFGTAFRSGIAGLGCRSCKIFFIMYFGYLLQPPPPLCELARPAEWGFVYMVITGYKIRSILLYYDVTILINSVTRR